ncbi:hypothetical protein [Micromonospora sp. NPDC049799]|uniref:hypothetical protein n=1 Tax=Micromonospora sp. NPDC049799 TaxID=3154741 RepID=UPI0033CA7B7A
MSRERVIYALLVVGGIGMFLGHGVLALLGQPSFVKLITGSFDRVLHLTVSKETAAVWLDVIGAVDLAIAALMLLMLIGDIRGTGGLYRFAYGRTALVVYTWAALWGFVTAGSRVTAVGELIPELWDVLERAPNVMLPATLAYLVYQHRSVGLEPPNR